MAKLINLEAELLYAGFSVPSGVLHAFAPQTVPEGEMGQHLWTQSLQISSWKRIERWRTRANVLDRGVSSTEGLKSGFRAAVITQ